MCWEAFVKKCSLPPPAWFRTNTRKHDFTTLRRSKRGRWSERPTDKVKQLSGKCSEETGAADSGGLFDWRHTGCGACRVKDAFWFKHVYCYLRTHWSPLSKVNLKALCIWWRVFFHPPPFQSSLSDHLINHA